MTVKESSSGGNLLFNEEQKIQGMRVKEWNVEPSQEDMNALKE